MKHYILFCLVLLAPFVQAQHSPLLTDMEIRILESELSGETAKRNLEYLTRLHRMRGSSDFRKAIDFITSKLEAYQLESVEKFQLPADGKTMFGTQKSRLAWEAESAELWEVVQQNGQWVHTSRLADWEAMPITLAEDSESGDVTAALVDVGAGTSEADYAGKDVRGKLVLTSSGPEPVVPLAITRFGAAGIVSYTQNQKTAWWKEDENLIRWGHLGSFSPVNTFCFMVSLKQARDFQQRMARGQAVTLHARVKATRRIGQYDFVTAVIKGADPQLSQQEIVFTCHLDHQRPGANDNASGSVTILEVARTLQRLIAEGRLPRPARTIRFIWGPEIEGSLAVLTQRPELARRIVADIHMDMVGGGPVTKSLFHVSRSPKSLPSFVSDVGESFGQLVNEQSDLYASGMPHAFEFVSPEGGREPLQAVIGKFSMGSDHDVYSEGSFGIPAVYMHDWPDRYIHTNFDLPANIDPTKLKRAGFIGAASGYFIAAMKDAHVAGLWQVLRSQSLRRSAEAIQRATQVDPVEAAILKRSYVVYERAAFETIAKFAAISPVIRSEAAGFYASMEQSLGVQTKPTTRTGGKIYVRNQQVKGPVSVFGYDYLEDHNPASATLALPQFQGLWGSDYAYEVLNWVDGKRTSIDIRNEVSAEFGPIQQQLVDVYLSALEQAGLVILKTER